MSFEYKDARRETVPLLFGVTGYTGSGKTYSSLRLATGMQKVIGGSIAVIDTESKRALQLADKFVFKHVAMDAPFSPLRYLEALKFCKSKGASIVVVDSATHEHSSEGGYLDMHEKFLDKRAGDDDGKRQRLTRQSWIEPSRQRKQLNDWIVHCGMNIIFCYRAKEGMDSNFKSTGWQPETTSALIWEMTARFLLTPGSDGRPTFNPQLALEKMLTKNPEFFREWFKQGMQIDENLGAKLAQWAKGDSNVQRKQPLDAHRQERAETVENGGDLRIHSDGDNPPAQESASIQSETIVENPPENEGVKLPIEVLEGPVTFIKAEGAGPTKVKIDDLIMDFWSKEKEYATIAALARVAWQKDPNRRFRVSFVAELDGVTFTVVNLEAL